MAEPGFTKVAVLGAAGRMGELLTGLMRAVPVRVLTFDKPLNADDLAARLPAADLVLLAVPITALDEVLRLVAPLLSIDTVLADICSVKVKPIEAMCAAHPGPVVGLHPMFGPVPPQDPALRRVAVMPGRPGSGPDEEAAGRAAQLMTALGFTPFSTTPQTHDANMALIQGLNYVTNAAYLAALAEAPDIGDFLVPSFRRRLEAARKMLTEDAAMFTAMFEANPYSHEAVRLFRSHLNVAAGGEVDLLIQRAAWWWRRED